jgi:hypothetical protein
MVEDNSEIRHISLWVSIYWPQLMEDLFVVMRLSPVRGRTRLGYCVWGLILSARMDSPCDGLS